MPLVAAEDASDKQSQHHVGQYLAVLLRSAESALQVCQRNTATLLGGGPNAVHKLPCHQGRVDGSFG